MTSVERVPDPQTALDRSRVRVEHALAKSLADADALLAGRIMEVIDLLEQAGAQQTAEDVPEASVREHLLAAATLLDDLDAEARPTWLLPARMALAEALRAAA